MRILVASLLLLVVAAAAQEPPLVVQPPPNSDIGPLLRADTQQRAEWANAWLRSDDPLRIAWGAWLARQDHQTGLVPLLVKKVMEYQPSTKESTLDSVQRDRHDALLVVLDALIEFGATVPVDEARKLYPEFAAQSMVLLVRSPDDPRLALFDIFHNARANWTWLAAGNVLVKSRPLGFTTLLLSRFTQHMTVSVHDPGFGSGYGGGGSECGFSARAPKSGWPPVGLYLLTQFPETFSYYNATFLVGGDTPVYYWRVALGNYDNPSENPGACHDGNRDEYRAQYLNRMMRNPRINLNPYPQVSITWKGEVNYRQELVAAVEEQRTVFHRVLASLRDSDRGLTLAEVETLKPRIEVKILDERHDRSTPLPAVLDATVSREAEFTEPLE